MLSRNSDAELKGVPPVVGLPRTVEANFSEPKEGDGERQSGGMGGGKREVLKISWNVWSCSKNYSANKRKSSLLDIRYASTSLMRKMQDERCQGILSRGQVRSDYSEKLPSVSQRESC